MRFSDWLKQAMREKGINQTQVAEMTDTTTHNVSYYINERSYPGWYTMNRMVTKLGYRIEIVPMHEEIKISDEFETAYMEGFDHGRQQMLKEIIKTFGRGEWYGGNKQEERAAGVPGDHEGRTGDLQHELQRTVTEEGHGGSMEPATGKGGNPEGSDSCV